MPPKKRAALQTVPSLPPAVKAAESRRRSQLIEDEAECGDDVGKDENEEEPNEYDKNDSFINDEDEEDTDVEQNEENLDSPPLFDFNPRPVKVQRKLEKKKMVAARKPPSSGARKRIFPQELMDDNDEVPAKKKKKSLKEANNLIKAFNELPKFPKDPFLLEQVEKLNRRMAFEKSDSESKAAYLNRAAMEIVLGDSELEITLAKEEEELPSPIKKRNGEEEEARVAPSKKFQILENKEAQKMAAKKKKIASRPELEQISDAIQAGDGFIAFAAHKTWGTGSVSKCVVLQKPYGENKNKNFTVNFSKQGALETKEALEYILNKEFDQ